MDPTEKAIAIALAVVAGIAVAVRSQSSPPPRPEPLSLAADPPEWEPRPVRALNIGTGLTGEVQRYQDPEDEVDVEPLKDDLKDEPDLTGVEDPSDEELAGDEIADAMLLGAVLSELSRTDPYVPVPESGPWALDDTQVLGLALQILDPEQRVVFMEMWRTLEPEERQEWLFQLRGSMMQ